MSLNKHNIKKWIKMIFGKSIYHVNQTEGLCYSFKEIRGYYNNLTEKVTKDKKRYLSKDVLMYPDENGIPYIFPVAIFQYGLGCYDLYLLGKDSALMKEKFIVQAKWAFENQNEDGSWPNFKHYYPNNPFSAMAQGEGCSLLVRYYMLTKNPIYLEKARKALDFMLLSVDDGGTSINKNDEIVLLEYTNLPAVFNGWVFAIFGLIDYTIATHEKKYEDILNRTVNTFKNHLPLMDAKYWSKYREDNMLASPFYHKLHIAQLSVLYKYTSDDLFFTFKTKFEKESKNIFKRIRAFLKKALQKIKE